LILVSRLTHHDLHLRQWQNTCKSRASFKIQAEFFNRIG
jgi:hypothetical protein